MSYIYKNITASTAIELVLDPNYSYDNMTLCNIHATDAVSVDLYITRFEVTDTVSVLVHVSEDGTKHYEDQLNTFLIKPSKENEDGRKIDGSYNEVETTTYTYYILKGLVMPFTSTLVLNQEELRHDLGLYQLYIKLNASDSAVDVKITQDEMNVSLGTAGTSGTSSTY